MNEKMTTQPRPPRYEDDPAAVADLGSLLCRKSGRPPGNPWLALARASKVGPPGRPCKDPNAQVRRECEHRLSVAMGGGVGGRPVRRPVLSKSELRTFLTAHGIRWDVRSRRYQTVDGHPLSYRAVRKGEIWRIG
jgi:hypothetical protein